MFEIKQHLTLTNAPHIHHALCNSTDDVKQITSEIDLPTARAVHKDYPTLWTQYAVRIAANSYVHGCQHVPLATAFPVISNETGCCRLAASSRSLSSNTAGFDAASLSIFFCCLVAYLQRVGMSVTFANFVPSWHQVVANLCARARTNHARIA